jgi:release factor glutamine methyltransferase
MKALEKLKEATRFLEESGLEDAVREAEIILIHCLGTDRTAFFRDNPEIPKHVTEKINECLKRRSKREPLQYILGSLDYLGIKIKVGKGVLIPRPETELLAEEALKTVTSYELQVTSKDKNSSLVTRRQSLSILDLCTGSGCLALALAKEFPHADVYGTDISEVAIRYAKENAEINGIKNVIFLKGSLFEPLRELFTIHSSLFTFDLIISNPPYIKTNDIKTLQPEIKDWEPIVALDGGEDGLDYYRLIILEAKNYLIKNGYLMLELGMSQAAEVRRIAENAGFTDISFKKDYAGIERIMIAK